VSARGWAKVIGGLRAQGKVPAAAKRRPSNQHAELCARKAGPKHPCTCGAADRAKALERDLLRQLDAAGIPPDRSDLRDGDLARFIPGRKYRGDAIYERARLVVELQGWAGGYGPHGGIAKAKADVEKHALAAVYGWRVLPATAADVKSGAAVQRILAAIAWRPEYGRLPTSTARPSAEA